MKPNALSSLFGQTLPSDLGAKNGKLNFARKMQRNGRGLLRRVVELVVGRGQETGRNVAKGNRTEDTG